MATFYSRVMSEVRDSVSEALVKNGFETESLENDITMPEKGFGDVACSVAFKIAKQKGANPKTIAEQLCRSITKPDFVKEIKAENGFVNFYLDRGAFSKGVIEEALSKCEAIAASDAGNSDKVIIEYPSVNPNKPWHIGHLRNALIGDVVANLYVACGYSVEREDYIDDMGLQVVEALWGVMNLRSQADKKYDHWLGELYVDVNKAMETRDMKADLAKLMEAMEQDGTYEAKLGRDMTEKCVLAQYKTAYDYKIYHDVLIWESDIVRSRLLEKALITLEKTGAVRKESSGKYENCLIMDFEKAGKLPDEFKGLKESVKVLVRSNGAPTYAAKDIAFHMWKFGLIEDPFLYRALIDRQPNGKALNTTGSEGKRMDYGNVLKAVNIIDMRQSYEQGIVKLAFQAMGKGRMSEGILHLAYNVVELEDGSFSGRKGTEGYTADELLAEAKDKAGKLISDRLKLAEEEKEKVADEVALAAIKFETLRVSPERKIVFSWKTALSFEGISGPYCQYMYARASRIIENSGMSENYARAADETLGILNSDEEFALVKLIAKCGAITEKACAEHRSNVLTDYVGNLAAQFSKFYEKAPVLKAERKDERIARVALLYSFKHAMRGTLSLLGIGTLERM